MSSCYFTIVKTTSSFSEKALLKHISGSSYFSICKFENNEITILSVNTSALNEIEEFSKQFPEEKFSIKIAGEDFEENYIYLYECQNGNIRLVHKGYEYLFCIDCTDLAILPSGVYERFCKKVVELLNYFPLNKISFDLNLDNLPSSDPEIGIKFSYKTKNYRLTAEKQGITRINVDVEFLDKPAYKSTKREIKSDYDDY